MHLQYLLWGVSIDDVVVVEMGENEEVSEESFIKLCSNFFKESIFISLKNIKIKKLFKQTIRNYMKL